MREVSLTHPVLAFFLYLLFSFLSGEFLLHIPRWLYFSVGSFSYTSHACLIFLWGVSLTDPVLASYLCGEFLLNIRYWLYFYLGSFSYTSHACFLFLWGVCLTHPELVLSLSLSLATTRLASFLCGEFLLHIPCWLFFFFFLSGQLLLRILRWLYFSMGNLCYTSHACLIFSVGSFSYTSHADFFFIFFYLGSFSNTSRAGFLFLFFISGSFSYTSRAGFMFLWGVSLTHPMLVWCFCGEFLLHIPCLFDVSVGSFSYTSYAGCFFSLFFSSSFFLLF